MDSSAAAESRKAELVAVPEGAAHEGAQEAALPDPAELLERFGPYCRRLIRKYGSSPELRQDLIGEIYCILHDLVQAYDRSRGVPLSAYLFSQLRCSVFTYTRSERRRQAREMAASRLEGDWWELQEGKQDLAWPDRLTLRESLLQAMGELTERQRAVVYLRYFQDREYDDIAAILGIKPATARSLVRHGLRRLRKILHGDLRPHRSASEFALQD
jgi:RNA polymerase sigma factor (sigma-70 family)